MGNPRRTTAIHRRSTPIRSEVIDLLSDSENTPAPRSLSSAALPAPSGLGIIPETAADGSSSSASVQSHETLNSVVRSTNTKDEEDADAYFNLLHDR